MKEKIIHLLNSPHHFLLSADEIYEALNLETDEDYDILGNALEELEHDFIIMHNKKNQFALLKYFNLHVGIIDIKESGFAFLDGEETIYISEQNTNNALNKDKVLVKVFKSSKNKNKEGEVVRVIERSHEFVFGTLIKYKSRLFVKGTYNKSSVFVKVNNAKTKDVGRVVKVKITKYFSSKSLEGEIVLVLGNINDVGMDITKEVLASGVKSIFDEDTLKEAKQIKQEVELKDYLHYKDLTNELMITIDGDDAKDFDDAVGLKKQGNNYILKVSIADVSEYVKENTALDSEALDRATSIYLPDRVIPMLPEALSNGICSLKEGVNRLTLTAEIEFDENADVLSSSFYPAIIKSKHRMTYSNVNKMLEDDEDVIVKYQDIYEMIQEMAILAKKLYDKRIKRGAFDFETAEAKLILNKEGKVLDIMLRERKMAEKLIEEFMLITNEAVAMQMTWLDVPFIYRVHDEPNDEKLSFFFNRMKSLKYNFSYKNKAALPKALQNILLADAKSSTEKTLKNVISTTLLRTMQKAKYQETNIGHYGLQSKCYTHFTSPIRRYPDLLVHRLMKEFLFNIKQVENPLVFFEEKVKNASLISSKNEKRAETLERQTVDMKKCEYMMQFMGNIYIGVVSSVVNWGIYITLENTVEGLARFDDLPYDYYEVYEQEGYVKGVKKQNKFSLGDVLKVKLIDVDKEKHQISFKVLGKEKID